MCPFIHSVKFLLCCNSLHLFDPRNGEFHVYVQSLYFGSNKDRVYYRQDILCSVHINISGKKPKQIDATFPPFIAKMWNFKDLP